MIFKGKHSDIKSEASIDSQEGQIDLESQKEIRHLKDIVTALRQELDICHAETEQKVSESVRDAGKEIIQLKEVAQSLRAEIDNLLLVNEQAVQKAHMESANEITQLKETIQNQREETESLQFEREN